MKLTLIKKVLINKDVVSFVFEPAEKIVWAPGQFMRFVLIHGNPDNRGCDRWFTISSAPFEKKIIITTRIMTDRRSSFKEALNSMKIGKSLEADKPMGDFTLKETKAHNIFLAGGIGITPFRSIFAQRNHDNSTINGALLYISKDDSFVFKKELDKCAHSLGIKIYYLGDLTRKTLSELAADNDSCIYISGPKGMVDSYVNLFKLRNYKENQIITDFFPGYE